MRRIVGPILLLSLVAAPRAVQGQQALVGIYPAGVGLDSGQQALVPVVIDLRGLGGVDLGAYQLQVTWNPAVIRYIRTTPGDFGAPTINESAATSGSLTLAGAGTAGRSGLFSVAHITFEMLVSSGSSPVTILSPELTENVTFASIPVVAAPGSVCTSAGAYGDVNGDGNILSNDALLVVTAAVGLSIAPYTLASADVDADGDADTRDALIILSSAVGLPTTGFRVGQSSGGCSGSPAAALALAPGALQLASGDVVPVTATLVDSAGDPTSAVGLVWSSDAPSVAGVDSAGRVRAVSNGSATVSAMAIGVPAQTVAVSVYPRHVWYVDAGANKPVELGSAAFPFTAIQTALNRAAVADTVLVVAAQAGYGPAVISKPVVVLGDSGAFGMPQIRNSTGPAIQSNAPGLVTLRRLALLESNAGVDARGDSLIIQSVSTASLRGPAFSVRGMQYASLWGISANSAILAGVFVDSTAVVDINGADIRVIANRNDSAAAVGVFHGGSAQVTDLHVVGVENGPAAVFGKLGRAVLAVFDTRAAGGVNVDSVGNVIVQLGTIRDASGADRALSVHADTVVLDSVVVNGADRAAQITPMAQDTVTQPNTFLTVTRSAVLNVNGQGGLIVDRMSQVHLSHMTVSDVQLSDGIVVTRANAVRIDSSTVTNIANGTAVLVDPVASLYMHGGKLRGHDGALRADRVQIVTLAGLDVDSSAIPPPFCFPCTPHAALWVSHADSVVLDSLNVHDNIGGGILVDSARVVVGTGTAAVRNLGFIGQPSECQECGPGNVRGSAPIVPRSAQFTLSNFPGAVLSLVQDSRLASWIVQDNAFGGLFFTGWNTLANPTAQITNSSFRAAVGTLLNVSGNDTTFSGQLTVQGGTFQNAIRAISAQYLDQFQLTGATIDSVGDYYSPAVATQLVRRVVLSGNTITRSRGWAIQIEQADTARVSNNVIQDGRAVDPFTPEASIQLEAVYAGFITGNRLERNSVRGIVVRFGGGPMTIDSNVVADDTVFAALQLSQAATVTRNLFARNATAIFVDFGGEPSQIHQNNFEGNLVAAIRNQSNDIANAGANWWNDALGPRCGGVVTGCDPGSTGDVASGLNFTVDYSGFLAARAGGAPIAAPPLHVTRVGASR